MKSKILFMQVSITILALVACNSAASPEPMAQTADPGIATAAQPDAGVESEEMSSGDCPEATSGAYQLIYAAEGICFLYPDNYDVFHGEDGSLTLYVRSLLNTEAPLAIIHFEAMDGRPIQEIVPGYPSDAELATISLLTIELGGEMATVFDNLPGQDTNRRVIATHNDKVYDLMIARFGDEYGAVGEEAEALYALITSSFQFIDTEPDAPLLAGPECPEPVENSTIYTNEPAGYCLLVPAAYTIQAIDPEAWEMAFFVGAIQDAGHARLYIKIEDADGRNLEEITADKAAEIKAAFPGFELMQSFGYMLDGVPANQFDQAPGQELSRQVVAVHNNRRYTLTFIPDDPAAAAYEEMQELYDMVMDTFSFTTTEEGVETEAASPTLTGSIFGWVWHDVCESGKNGEPPPALPPEGCIESGSPQGTYYRADSKMDALEPAIPGIIVRLGQGACPATGLAEVTTIATDISYSFMGLNAGIYCVSINSSDEPNFSLLVPGMWTYPEVTEGTAATTVTLGEGQNVYDINFGWDYQFLP